MVVYVTAPFPAYPGYTFTGLKRPESIGLEYKQDEEGHHQRKQGNRLC